MTTPEPEDARLDAVLRAALDGARAGARDRAVPEGAPTGPRSPVGFAAAANADRATSDQAENEPSLNEAAHNEVASRAELDALYDLDDVDDALLIRWRNGQLDAAQTALMDARLATDGEARARAVALLDAPREAAYAEAERLALALRRRPMVRWLAMAAAALAVGLGAWLVSHRASSPLAPEYTSSGLQGGMAAVRGPDAPPGDRFLADGTLTVNLRPATAQAAPPVAVFVSEAPSGVLRSAGEARVETFDNGAIRVRATVGPLVGNRPGRYTLHLALGASTGEKAVGHLPEEARRQVPQARWFDHAFELLPDPPEDPPTDREVPP